MPKRFELLYRKLDAGDRPKLALKTFQSKRVSFFVMAVLILIFEAFMIVTMLSQTSPLAALPEGTTYLFLYFALFGVTLFSLLLLVGLRRYHYKKPVLFLNLGVIYAFFICYWSSYLTAYVHHNTAGISVFVYVCLAVSVLIPMKPWHAALLYVSNWSFFMIILPAYLNPAVDPFASQLNSAFVSLLSMIIAIVFYYARLRDYLNEKTILMQSAQIQEMNVSLNEMVMVDELTRIQNRRFMEREFPHILDAARRDGLPVALLMIDIDLFKKYNDRYGHQAGDRCLYQVVSVVSGFLPAEHSYFVRYGGEEFLLLLVGMEPEEVRDLAEKIRQGVEEAGIEHEDSPEGHVTISIGVCCSRRDGEASLNQLIRYADTAVYDAKAAGRNKVFVFRFTDEPPETV